MAWRKSPPFLPSACRLRRASPWRLRPTGRGRFRRLRPGRVVGAVHKVLRDDAALDVAVVAAADAQQGLVGAGVEFATTSAGAPVVSARAAWPAGPRRWLRRLARCRGEAHAVGNGAQGFGVHEGGQAGDDAFRRSGACAPVRPALAGQGLRVGAAGGHAGVVQRNAQQELSSAGPSFRYSSSLPFLTLYSGGWAM